MTEIKGWNRWSYGKKIFSESFTMEMYLMYENDVLDENDLRL